MLGNQWKIGYQSGEPMPERFFNGFDPAGVKAMFVALDKACKELGLMNTHDAATESLAKIVVEQARTGERDPDRLCAMTLEALRDG